MYIAEMESDNRDGKITGFKFGAYQWQRWR